jgi:hypothetical protein
MSRHDVNMTFKGDVPITGLTRAATTTHNASRCRTCGRSKVDAFLGGSVYVQPSGRYAHAATMINPTRPTQETDPE